jgi:hypothetical protein
MSAMPPQPDGIVLQHEGMGPSAAVIFGAKMVTTAAPSTPANVMMHKFDFFMFQLLVG